MKLSFDAVVGLVSLAMSPTLATFSFEKSVAGKACEQAELRSPTMLNTETEATLTVNFRVFSKDNVGQTVEVIQRNRWMMRWGIRSNPFGKYVKPPAPCGFWSPVLLS